MFFSRVRSEKSNQDHIVKEAMILGSAYSMYDKMSDVEFAQHVKAIEHEKRRRSNHVADLGRQASQFSIHHRRS